MEKRFYMIKTGHGVCAGAYTGRYGPFRFRCMAWCFLIWLTLVQKDLGGGMIEVGHLGGESPEKKPQTEGTV